MQYLKTDYPFSIGYQDKLSDRTGKMYSAMSISLTSIKDKDAVDNKEKYKTDYLNFFNPEDLLKLSTLCQTAYIEIKAKKLEEKRELNKLAEQEKQKLLQEKKEEENFIDDNMPF